jgi:hypothetical protein
MVANYDASPAFAQEKNFSRIGTSGGIDRAGLCSSINVKMIASQFSFCSLNELLSQLLASRVCEAGELFGLPAPGRLPPLA